MISLRHILLFICSIFIIGTVTAIEISADDDELHIPIKRNTYYVSTSGLDTNPGSITLPFRTIQKSADMMKPGDTTIVQAGIYRESIVVPVTGEKQAPIRIIAAQGSEVIIDGTDLLTRTWKKYKGKIYKTKFEQDVSQLFLDRKLMTEARWPNLNTSNPWNRSNWASTDKGSRYGRIIDESLIHQNINWRDSRIVLNVAHQFFTWTRKVTKDDASYGKISYPKDLSGLTKFIHTTTPWEDDYYYLVGNLEALDSEGEWFYDESKKILYLWAKDGMNPSAFRIETKKRNIGLIAKNKQYIEIKGLKFFGSSLILENVNHATVDGCHFMHPSHSREDITDHKYSIKLQGNYNRFANSSISYTESAGLKVNGSNNYVENNIINNICFNGSLKCPAIRSKGNVGVGFNVIRNNTIYNTGSSAIVYGGQAHVIENNHIYSGGLASKDVSLIQGSRPSIAGSILRYNWVHDSSDKCIRGDDQTRNLTIHHNVVWNCQTFGLIVKGNGNLIYNNTVLDGKFLIPTRGEKLKPWKKQTTLLEKQNSHSRYYNNVGVELVFRGPKIKPGSYFSNNYFNANLGKVLTHINDGVIVPKRDSKLIDGGITFADFKGEKNGMAPDIGAYESGSLAWVPGANWEL